MVAGVPRGLDRNEAAAAQHDRVPVAEDLDAVCGDAHHLPEQTRQVVPIEPPRAGHQAGGIDEVGGADGMDVDLDVGEA